MAAVTAVKSMEAVDAECDTWSYPVVVGNQKEVLAAARRMGTYNKLHFDPKYATEKGLPDIVVPAVMIGGFVDQAVTSELHEVFARDVRLKFSRSVHPGDTLVINCRVTERSRRGIRIEIDIEKDGKIAARGFCSVVPL